MGKSASYPGVKRVLGGHEIRVPYIDPRTGLPKEARQTVFCSFEDAVALKLKWQKELEAEPDAEPKTVGVFADEWFARKRVRLGSLLTQERYAEAIKNHIKAPVRFGDRIIVLGNIMMSKLKRTDIEDWMAAWASLLHTDGKKKGQPVYQAATINGWWRILKTILRSAVGDQLESDVTMGVTSLPLPAAKDDNNLTPDEMRAFFALAWEWHPTWYAMLVTLGSTGARPGELRALRWGADLDEATGRLVIQQSQCRNYLGPVKNKKTRGYTLPRQVLEILLEHRKRMIVVLADVAIDHNRMGVHAGLVFPSPRNGGYVSPSCLQKPIKDIMRRAGINARFTPKGFRRSFNTFLLEGGFDPLVIRALTGHSSDGVRGIYTIVRDEQKAKPLAKVIDLVGVRSEREKAEAEPQLPLPLKPKKSG